MKRNHIICGERTPRLLITMPWGIGDAVHIGSCAVDQITQNDPDGHVTIHILCNHLQAPIFSYDPRLHSVIAVSDDLFPTATRGTWKRGIFLSPEAVQLAKQLRLQQYTAVLPIFFGPTFFALLHTPLLLPTIYEAWRILRMFRASQEISLQQVIRSVINKGFGNQLAAPGVDEPTPLYLCAEHMQKARQYVVQRNIRAGLPQNYRPWLLVAPDTSSVITRPPTSLLAQGIADALEKDARLFVEILPGYTDPQAAYALWHTLALHFPDRTFLMPAHPKLPLLDLAALIDQNDIFITGDTSTMHLAAASKMVSPGASTAVIPQNAVKIIALFGGTHPGLHGYSQRSIIIGKGRKEQTTLAPGIAKEMHRPQKENFFDHISSCQITSAILSSSILPMHS
jgi:ADP-heptose:LPS heptosyltransferase